MSIDARILAVYTKLAHLAQRLTGRTCYWFAQQCAVLIACSFFIDRWTDATVQEPMSVSLVGAACWLGLAIRARHADAAFASKPDALPDFLRSDHGKGGRRFRLLMIGIEVPVQLACVTALFSDGDSAAAIQVVANCALVSYFYLRAVVPLPPARQRDRVRGTLIPHLQGAR